MRNSLKSLMWRGVGVRRSESGLHNSLSNIDRLQQYVLPYQFQSKQGWELQNMLIVGRLMVSAALEREESRGVHLRVDFPETDDTNWRRHIITGSLSS